MSDCDPMNRSTPGLPVHHQLLEFTQTHAHWVCDANQKSHPLSSPSPPTLNLSQHQGLFKWVSHFAFLHFFLLRMVLIPVSCTMLWTSVRSSSSTLSIRSSRLNLFFTSSVYSYIYIYMHTHIAVSPCYIPEINTYYESTTLLLNE